MGHHLSQLRFLADLALLDEILASAECSVTGTSDDSDAERGLTVEPGHEAVGFPVRGVREGVHGFGAVDGNEEDVRSGVGEDVRGSMRWLGLEVRGHDHYLMRWLLRFRWRVDLGLARKMVKYCRNNQR